MLMIRFQRIGRVNDPAFRIVVNEKTAGPKAGKYVDLVGTYNPRTKAFTINADRVKEWIAKGAQLSPSLHNLLVSKGIIEGKKIAVVSKTNLEKNVKVEEPTVMASVEEAPAAEAAPEAASAEEAPAAEAPAEEAAPAA